MLHNEKRIKVIVFGLGNVYKTFFKRALVEYFTVLALSDNNAKLWGTTIEGKSVIQPNDIMRLKYDYVVICSYLYKDNIKNQLIGLGIPEEKICDITEFERIIYSINQYSVRYGLKSTKANKVFANKLVIYTSITGDYDELNTPTYLADGIEYICFTNNKKIKSDVWEIRLIEDENLDNMHLAKKVKVFPNIYLPEFSTSVWVDGKFRIVGDIRDYIRVYQCSQSILCFPHFERECIYEEAGECLSKRIGKKDDILCQILNYYQEGYPVDNGLFEMGCIVRNHNDPIVVKIMNDWWEEICKYSYRDQISFPYVCWKNDYLPDVCGEYLYKNRWIEYIGHKV